MFFFADSTLIPRVVCNSMHLRYILHSLNPNAVIHSFITLETCSKPLQSFINRLALEEVVNAFHMCVPIIR